MRYWKGSGDEKVGWYFKNSGLLTLSSVSFLQDMQLLLLQKRHFKPSVLPNAIQDISYREEQSRGRTLSQVGSNVFIMQTRITDKRKPQVHVDGLFSHARDEMTVF